MSELTSRAPGRVELLGNHTDYNGGVVLSAAISCEVTARGKSTDDDTVRVASDHYPDTVALPLHDIAPRSEQEAWANYPLGVVDVLKKEGYPISGFQMQLSSTLPSGAGLSSSAALEVATACLLKKIFSLDLLPLPMAKLCRRAENEFVGVQCGLLDQVSSIFGRAGHAVYLDCRSEQIANVPLPAGTALLVFQSGVEHRLVGGEYNERRQQCFAAAAALGVPALRDVSHSQLDAARDRFDPTVYRRACHIVGENERVFAGLELLRAGDAAAFGALMFASHESSRTNFENSTPELDILVEIAKGIPGVFGSRLTGGGFGGATISLVEQSHASPIAAQLETRYLQQTGHRGLAFLCESADGAS